MTPEQFRLTPPGLYLVTFKGGETAQAAIGEASDGGRWIACTHWFEGRSSRRTAEAIQSLSRILVTGAVPPEDPPGRQESPGPARAPKTRPRRQEPARRPGRAPGGPQKGQSK